MRHMRSRRILAMLLALSMIFGLLTTTAFAGEVDQNPSNVGESAANGTSESGSGEGQSSGASDGQPSQETNKKDVPTEEETTPEEKKTTSSEEGDPQAGEGENPTEETTYVASIGEQGYASLDAAIQAAASGATVTLLDNVELTATLTISNKDITLDVDSNTLTVSVSNGDGIVVENATLTLASSGTGKYVFKCSARNSDGIYVNNTDASTTSTLNLNGDVEINVQASVNSAIHAYATAGNAIVNINGGKITATGSGKQFKAIHVDQNATLNMAGGELDITVDFDSYSDNNDVVGVLIFGNSSKQENCHVVISDGIFKVGGKNAFAQVVQVGMVNGYSENCDVSITGGTVKLEPTENGTGYVYAPYKASYATAAISGGTVTGTVTALVNAYISDVTNDGLTVTGGTFPTGLKDSIEKHLGEGCTMDANGTVSSSATPATGVATVGGVSYDTLEKAFAALSDTAHTLTLNDESAWNTATPVYWKAGDGEYSAAATLVDALTEAYKANAGDITIICRPGADVGKMTHGHVADNLTIYGNNAYVSAGECDLEVDTYKYDRSTGKQVEGNGEYLTKDITINAYELDNLGVWGERHTEFAVNVNLTDCDGKEIDGKTNVQRVYISGTTGVNNITLTGCDFVTKATSVYSNADGEINITNCSFTGAQVPVNFNHKANGEQTLRVSNCEFNACGDKGEWAKFAAPVRFVNSGSGTQSATVDTCTFADTVGLNGDILIGDGRLNQQFNNVSLTVTNTTATVMAQKPGYYTSDGTTDDTLKGEKKLTASESLTNASIDSLIGGTTATKGTEANPYTLGELGKMTRDAYIDAQTALGGTMYVSVGDYSYDKDGVLGNGVRDDTPGQIPDHSKLNAYGENGYLGEKNDGANGLNIVFVNGSITSGVTGYTSIDNIGTSLLLAVPAYTNVTFKGITFNNVMSFNYQLYTGPWSQLGELKFEKCTFNGIIVGAIAAQTLTFNGCTFNDYTNETSANSSNPTWIRPAYGNWKESDNDVQGQDFKSLTTINFTDNKVTSTRPVKFEYISQWNNTTTLTATGNSFDISAQEGDTKVKNVGMYFGSHTDENAFNLILGTNEKLGTTAALYTLKENQTSLPVGSTVKDPSGTEIEITDALEWKTENKITLKTESVPAVKNVAKVGETEYETLAQAIAEAGENSTVTLLADVNTPETTYVISKSLTIDLNGKTITGSGYDGVFQIDGKGAHVLIKNGNVVAVEQSGTEGKYTMAVWACAENCVVTLQELKVTQKITHTDDKQMDMIYTSKGTIIIDSGFFESGTPAWTLNCKDAAFKDGSAKIIVNGGTFTGFDPCNNAAEGKGTSFVAEGVGVDYDENGSFTAKAGMVAQVLDASGNSVKAYKTLAEAFTEASEGQTVRLLKDLKEDVEITKNITLDLGGKTLTNTGKGNATITIAKDATATVKNGSVVGGTSYYNIQNNGTATFEGLTATAGNDGSSMIDNYGTLTITSGEYTGGLDTIKNEPNAKLTVDGGTFTLTKGTGDGFTGVIFNYGELTINDGTFIQNDKSAPYGQAQVIHTDKSGSNLPSTVIKGGTFKNLCTAKTAWTVRATNAAAGATKVSGGSFNTKVQETYCADGFIPTKNADGTYGVKEGKYVATTGKNNFETLEKAVSLVAKNGKITLLADVDANIEIGSAKNFTLDLNGHTINGGTVKDKATITNYGTVTITDSSAAQNGTIKRDDNGTVGETSFYVIRNIGTMTIEQAIVTNNSGYRQTNPSGSMNGSSLICNGDNDLGGTLNISGGKFEQKNFIAIKNGALGKLNVTGGTISSDHSAIQNWFDATITGGEINGQLWTDAYIADESVGHTTIGGSAKYTGEIVMDISGSVKPTLEISGGTLDVTNWRITTAASKAGAKPAVSGGKFTSAVPEDYCADGYVPTENEDGTYGVKETLAAKIGDAEYETLAAAFAAAKDGETIVLLKDSSGDGIVVDKGTFTDKGLIVDFNNHSYTVGGVLVGSSGTASNGFQLNMDNKITFKNGALYGDASVAGDKTTNWTGAPAIMIQNYSNLTLEKMTVVGGKETCYTISNNCGDTLIKNSTITAGEASTKPAYQPARAFDVCGFSTYPGATVTVENSTINGAVEISNGNNSKVALTIGKGTTVSGSLVDGGNGDKVAVTKDKSVSVAAPNGYKWVDGENGQTLAKIVMVAEVNGKQYETLQEAIDAASKNQTVKLIADTTENVTMKTPYLTLDLNGHTLNGGQVKGTPALTVTARVTVKDTSAEQTGTIMREDTADNSGVSSHYVIDIQGNGWLTFESGNVTNNSGVVGVKGASLVRVGDDSVAKYPGLNIKGGSFRQDNFIAIKVDRGDLFLNGGTITSANSYAIENWHRATIKGGTVKGSVASWTYSGGSNSTTTIIGGTINGNVNSVNYGNAEDKTAKVTISGGTVNGELDTRSYDPTTNELTSIDDAAKATIGVTGGTFSKDPTKYVVEGSSVTTNSDGTFGVEKAYLCKVGETKYYTMEDAFKAQTTIGEPIVLLRDYTTGSSFPSGSINRTVDLDGHTWTYTGSDVNSAAFEVNHPNVMLTVKNGTVVSNSMVGLIPTAMGGTITYDNSGLVFESVEATANGHSGIETNGGNESVSVTLKDSTLNVPNGFGIYFPSSGTLTIENSKITAMTLGVQVCSGNLDISGAETKIEVTGDGVEKTENDGAIQDGAAISIVNRAGYKGLGTITVTGGTFTAKSGNAAVKAYNWENKTASDFTASDKVAISGGTFSSAVAPEYCAEGFEPKDNGDGTYGVQPDGNVAEIGSVKYASLDEALKAAKDRETVKLLKDAELEEVVIRSGRTLDLNGHTLKADYVTYFGGNLVDNSAAHTGLLKVLSADEILFTKNKKIDAMTQIPIYSLEKQGYVFEEIVLRVASVTNKTPGALQAVYRPRQKDGKTDLSDAQKAMFGSANGHPVTATFRLVYKYKNSNEVQTFEFDFVDTYMDIYLNQNLYMYVTVTGLDIANIETITVTPVLKSAGGQVELVGKTIDTAAVLANLIGQ